MWRVAASPRCVQVLPASVERYTPLPHDVLWRLFCSPVPTPHDVRIGERDRDVTERADGLIVEDRRPGRSLVHGFQRPPDAVAT